MDSGAPLEYARWSADCLDVQELKPDWDCRKCEIFLKYYEDVFIKHFRIATATAMKECMEDFENYLDSKKFFEK